MASNLFKSTVNCFNISRLTDYAFAFLAKTAHFVQMPAKHVALDALLYFQTNDSNNFFTLAKTRAFAFACRFEQSPSFDKSDAFASLTNL